MKYKIKLCGELKNIKIRKKSNEEPNGMNNIEKNKKATSKRTTKQQQQKIIENKEIKIGKNK